MKNYIRMLFYSALVVGLTLACIQAKDASHISLLDTTIPSPSGEVSLYEVADQLRKDIFVNVEGSTQPIDSKAEFGKKLIPLYELLELIKKSLGYDYSIAGDEITFVDPDVRKFGKNYPLDVMVKRFDIDQVTVEDAIDTLAKEQKLSLMSTSLNRDHATKLISLHLTNLTVREVLNRIAKESGSSGWNSSGGFPKGDEQRVHPFVIITM